jgi:hypothetical protein
LHTTFKRRIIVYKGLSLKCLNIDIFRKRKDKHKENEAIQFDFDMDNDASENVAQEMVCIEYFFSTFSCI